mmetsp:Transcript_12655/g.44790  ORF Transcript_12655/g.44790 Transcript_12655/m.44790 type:complete len:175 (-) Transcript_12655:130-654(-)
MAFRCLQGCTGPRADAAPATFDSPVVQLCASSIVDAGVVEVYLMGSNFGSCRLLDVPLDRSRGPETSCAAACSQRETGGMPQTARKALGAKPRAFHRRGAAVVRRRGLRKDGLSLRCKSFCAARRTQAPQSMLLRVAARKPLCPSAAPERSRSFARAVRARGAGWEAWRARWVR